MLFFPANIGVSLNIEGALNGLRVDKFFFTETPGFILQVKEEKESIFLKIASEYNVKTHLLGKPCKRRKLIIKEGKKVVVDADVEELERVWRGGIWGIF
jgi:selenophosphate synthetase-related protein